MQRYWLRLLALPLLIVATPSSRIIRAQTTGEAFGYPTCLSCPEPTVTPEARSHHVEGIVFLEVVVTERGAANQIEIRKGLEYGLNERAVAAVKRWRFKPATGVDGKPRSMRIGISVCFGFQRKCRGIATG